MTAIAVPTDQAPLPAGTARANRGVAAGRIISGLVILALAADAGFKLFAADLMIANTPSALGMPADPGFYRLLGAILATCVALYAWPRTAALGATLLTGYLGGAVATHARVGDPLFSHTLFGVYLGLAVWAGLYLRSATLRTLMRGN